MSGFGLTIADVVAKQAASQPERPVVRFEDSTLSYRQIDETAGDVASRMTGLGVGKGDRVATMLPNRPEAITTWIGLTRAGIVEVPLNTALKGELLADQLTRAGCRVVITDGEHHPRLTEVSARAGLERILTVDEAPSPAITLGELPPQEPAPVDVSDLDTSLILYTSGTTGPSKGVVLSHRANFQLAGNIVEYAGLNSGDVLFTVFPLFHIAARFVSVLAAMLCDGEVVVHRSFSASRFWDTCRQEGITAIHYLGSVPMMLWKQPRRSDDADNPVRVAYGAGLPAAIWEDFEHRYGLRTHELYGSTEQGVVAMTSVAQRKRGTCGRPLPSIDLEIHDGNDLPLGPGDVGEIVVRPKEPGVFFDGYDGMPEATLAAFRNLWFHTGDAGALDESGFLRFHGRLKDAIRYRGENISAWEVEHTLLGHPHIADVAAVGVPSELGEEDLLVVVVPADPRLTPAEVRAHSESLLPSFAVPRYIRIVAELPRTPSDRVEKWRLRDEGVTDDTWDHEKIQGRR